MSTKSEQLRHFKTLGAKYKNLGQHIVKHQSGYLAQFGDVSQPDEDTFRPQKPSDVDSTWAGNVPHQDSVDPNEKGEVTGVIDAIQKAIETVADSNPELSDSLKRLLTWASTSDVLKKTPGNPAVRKAAVNPNGPTAPMQHYPDNKLASTAGPKATIPASALSDLTDGAKALIKKYEKLGLVSITL